MREEEMIQPIPRLLFAGTNSGCGKTTIVCGILSALQQAGKSVVACKCGPDYIDPMFHEQVLQIPSQNLDLFFSRPEEVRYLLGAHAKNARIAVMEGVMGFYDGCQLDDTNASSYDLAKVTQTPVVLIVNAKGMALSVLALLKGFLTFRGGNTIAGVILNQVSPMTGKALARTIEKELGVPVYGCIPPLKLQLESRHLGLVTPQEQEHLQERMQQWGKQIAAYVDLDGLLALADTAKPLSTAMPQAWKPYLQPAPANDRRQLRVAVAKDAAFCFYYKENLTLLEQLGCTLCTFSPLQDTQLPKDTDVLLLGGGYPELYAKELAANQPMKTAIHTYLQQGGFCLAECGGFMYLLKEMKDPNGNAFPMVGYLQGTSENQGHLVRFGYHTLHAKAADGYLYPHTIKAHEFHYWDSDNNGASYQAEKLSGRHWDCMHVKRGQILGYPHLYYASGIGMLAQFLDACRRKEV